jgi:hypothetical protein
MFSRLLAHRSSIAHLLHFHRSLGEDLGETSEPHGPSTARWKQDVEVIAVEFVKVNSRVLV